MRSSAGARVLSASQLPWFSIRPPAGSGVLTTTGRKTGKTRSRCVRALRRDDQAFLVGIASARAGTMPGWAINALAGPDVRLRIRGGRFAGIARRPENQTEIEQVRAVFCETVTPFDFLMYANWRKGRPTRARIKALLGEWFEAGTPLVIEIKRER